MNSYEIRLLNSRGGTILLYFTQCGSEAEARRSIDGITNTDYARYELWRGTHMICDGARGENAGAGEAASSQS